MKTRVATIILNRNLGIITNNLYKKIYKYNRKYTDIFVIDSGSDVKKNQNIQLGQLIGKKQNKMVYVSVEV